MNLITILQNLGAADQNGVKPGYASTEFVVLIAVLYKCWETVGTKDCPELSQILWASILALWGTSYIISRAWHRTNAIVANANVRAVEAQNGGSQVELTNAVKELNKAVTGQ